MKQRSILVTLLLCVLLLTGCGTAAPAPDATPTPAQEAAATPTPTPDPLSTLPYEDGQLYAACNTGAGVKLSDLSEYLGITEKSVRSRIKNHNDFYIKNGQVCHL